MGTGGGGGKKGGNDDKGPPGDGVDIKDHPGGVGGNSGSEASLGLNLDPQ